MIMRSVNKVILIGNVVRDPELKESGGKEKLCTFPLATNREWYSGEGQDRSKKSLPEFHNITAWGNIAMKCHQFLKKGKLIYVEGYLKTRKFDNEDGTKSYRTEIVIYEMIMLDKRGDNGNHGMEDDDMGDLPSDQLASLEASSKDVSSSKSSIDSLDDNVFK